MPQQYVPRLGLPPAEDDYRDAVHVAVLPAAARHMLSPGDHVARYPDGTFGHSGGGDNWQSPPLIGVVDPYLRDKVNRGERFWLLLYPGTITSLRHEWIHPDIDVAKTQTVLDHIPNEDERAASETWLRNFCGREDTPGYETTMAIIRGEAPEHRQWSDEYIHTDGIDGHASIPPEFWHHVEIVLGRRIPMERRAKQFSCSC